MVVITLCWCCSIFDQAEDQADFTMCSAPTIRIGGKRFLSKLSRQQKYCEEGGRMLLEDPKGTKIPCTLIQPSNLV